jgi:MFS family permease
MRRLLYWVVGGELNQNGWYLVLEIFWASIFGTAISFNAALAIRLGATNTQVSWLSSGSALMALLIVPLAGRFMQGRAKRRPWLLLSLFLYRGSMLLLIFIPMLRQTLVAPGLLVILVVLAAAVPVQLFNVGFNPFLSEAIAVEDRATVFAARNVLAGVAGTAFSVIFGWLLVTLPFPLNYQVMLSTGLVFALLSQYYLARVRVEEAEPAPAAPGPAAPRPGLRPRWTGFVDGLRAAPEFVQFSVNTFLHAFGMWMAGPLYTLYLLRELHLGENWLGVMAALGSVVSIVGYMLWRRIMQRWGEPKTLKVTMLLLGTYPLLLGLTGWLPLILLAAVVHALVASGVNIAHLNTFLRVTPPDKRHAYNALNMTFMNGGIMVAPFIAVALANRFGFGPVLVGCGVAAILGATSFVIWPVGEGAPAPALVPGPTPAGH